MSSQLPLNDTDFWWLRYVCGIALPIIFAAFGIYSLLTQHSLAPFDGMHRGFNFVIVHGRLALASGLTYLGLGIVLFGNCFAQYHDKMGFYYERFVGPGALMLIIGVGWCSWIYLAG
jgi:hypothetical protein